MTRTAFEIDRIISDLRSRYIVTERDAMIRHEIDRLLRRNEHGDLMPEPVLFSGGQETHGVVITDEAGGGKSTIISRVLSTHPALGPSPCGLARYMISKVSSPATLKSFGCEVLRSTGYLEVSERKPGSAIWSVLRHRLGMQGVVCLVIEEAHDLRSSGSIRQTLDILNACKSLLSSSPPVIVILCGVPILNGLFCHDPQADRRFTKISLPPVTTAHDGPKLQALMEKYCATAGLTSPANETVVQRLIHASANRFGMCIENLINAIEEALKNGDADLTLMHFSRSWAATAGVDLRDNPFVSNEWLSIVVAGRTAPSPFGRFKA